ncbi:MAG: M48 family metalloprotease [Immundisolibacteraceae bacterium]|nr:M48 family metalloprotease [Immundisolibacteraceae bacterium]
MAAMKKRLISLLLILPSLITGCAVNPVSGQREMVLMSESQEIAAGRQSHPKIIAQYGIYDDPELQAYVSRIGTELANQSHRSGLIYRFTVLDSTDINAFALPGGYIYITRGLLAYLNSEAELAAVLGHEIGHVTARHGVRQQTAATAAGLGYTIASILIPELGNGATSDLYGLLSNALLSGYGREHELEADRLGAEYLARTGSDPQAMIAVISVLKNQDEFGRQQAQAEGREHQGYHGLFSSHPTHDTRLQQVVAQAQHLVVDGTPTINREPFLNQIDGLVFGDSAAQGIRRGRNFYHPDMGFGLTFPTNWAIKNLPDRLIAIANNGDAQITLRVDDINRRIDPQQFIIERLGIKHLTQGKVISSHGLQGYTGLTQLKTAQGKRLGRVSVVYFDQQAFIFVGAAVNEAQAIEIDKLFLSTAKSLHRLSNAERKLAQPLHLKITTASAGSRYARFAKQSPIDSYAEQQLRLLNNHYPTGEPSAQSRIKIVQ